MTESEKIILKAKLAEELPPLIARADIDKITGGVLKPCYMANLDCQGRGISNPIKMDKKVVYTRDSLIDFLIERMH